ncbi:MAG: methyltransferase domain-containing protein [Anaerolineae bacterium]
MTIIFALITRGLEQVCRDEMAALPNVTIVEIGYRRIRAQCLGSLLPLLTLRTVDDVFAEVATWTGVTHTRDTLALLNDYSEHLALQPALEACRAVREISEKPSFSVSASFVGKRNYSTDDLKAVVADGIATAYGWPYVTDDQQAEVNIRLFIEHETAVVGLRLGQQPLHERQYKQIERPGSLKPPIAAAMLQMAHVKAGTHLLDPCCGSGTIIIEAAQMGAMAQGSDLNKEAVKAARSNAKAADIHIRVEQWDARHVRLPDHSIDRVVSNLPWGRQIAVDDTLAAFYSDVCRELERIITSEGRVVLLTSAPQLLHFERFSLEQAVEISLFGQRPTIAVFAPTR